MGARVKSLSQLRRLVIKAFHNNLASLGLKMIAWGVEKQEHVELLFKHGCGERQGGESFVRATVKIMLKRCKSDLILLY
jgi:hypothetical protein